MHLVSPKFMSSAVFGLMLPTQFFEGVQLRKRLLRSYFKHFYSHSLTINSTEWHPVCENHGRTNGPFFLFLEIICWFFFLQNVAIDPRLVDHSHSKQIGTVPGSFRQFELEERLDNGEHIEQSDGPSPSKSSTRDDRARPTTYNPLYGFVEGVKRGSTDWSTYKHCDNCA